MKNEVNHAFSGQKAIFTFRAEDVQPSKSLGFYLARHHWTDGFDGPLDVPAARLATAVATRLGAAAVAPATVAAPARRIAKRRAPRAWQSFVPWGIAGLAVAVAAWALTTRPAATRSGGTAVRMEVSMPPRVELFPGTYRSVAVAPDSSQVAFIGVVAGSRRLYLRPFDQFEASPVNGTDNATTCFFSQDGRSVGFIDAAGVVKAASLDNGTVSVITDNASLLFGATWAGQEVIFVRDGTLWRASAGGGAPVQVTKLDASRGETLHGWPVALPGGRTVLFATVSTGGNRVDAVDLASGQRRVIAEDATIPLYVEPGRMLFFRNAELLSVPFDAERLAVTGEPARAAEALKAPVTGIVAVDASVSGTVVYTATAGLGRLAWVTREGGETPLDNEPRSYATPRFSPDDSRLVVQAGAIWLKDIARGTFARLTTTTVVGGNAFPAWTPDSNRIIFRGNAAIEIQSADGGPPTSLPGTTPFDYPGSFTPDGRTVVLIRSTQSTSFDLFTIPFPEGGTLTPVLNSPAYEGGARLSPDGKWLAYISNNSGQFEVYVRPFMGDDRRWQVSNAGGTQPAWNRQGGELFYRNGDKMMAVTLTAAGSDLTLSPPKVLFDQRYAFGPGISIANYDVTRDGKRFVMVKAEEGATRLHVVMNAFR